MTTNKVQRHSLPHPNLLPSFSNRREQARFKTERAYQLKRPLAGVGVQ